MRRPDRRTGRTNSRPSEQPGVVDLNARRRAAELQKQALKAARPRRRGPDLSGGLAAWGVLIVLALIWALLRWLQA